MNSNDYLKFEGVWIICLHLMSINHEMFLKEMEVEFNSKSNPDNLLECYLPLTNRLLILFYSSINNIYIIDKIKGGYVKIKIYEKLKEYSNRDQVWELIELFKHSKNSNKLLDLYNIKRKEYNIPHHGGIEKLSILCGTHASIFNKKMRKYGWNIPK